MEDLAELLPFATPSQREKIQAVIDCGSQVQAAKKLGVHRKVIYNAIAAAKRSVARMVVAPAFDMTKAAPDGYSVKGFSTYYSSGELKGQWVKSERDKENQIEALREITSALCEEVSKKSKIVSPPKFTNDMLLSGYPIPEPHMGMFSWGRETGSDYDCKIATDLLRSTMHQLVESSPPSERCLLASIGDFFHTDTTKNVTAQAGNHLDVDTRWPRVVREGIKAFRELVERALHKHKHVDIVVGGGNHDDQTSYMLALILQAYYANNQRVTVDLGVSMFKYHVFGANLIGIYHGHTTKQDNLPGIMATDKPEDLGTTKHRVWWTGHIHHLTRKEYPGCVVESFRSIAAKDSWHSGQGYRSDRDMQCIVYHKDRGEIMRTRVVV